MPTLTCPSCGERGKIGSSFIGSRLKCKKCGLSFVVSAPAAKQTAGATAAVHAAAVETPGGIEVEGLDASHWSLSTDVGVALKAEATAEPDQPAEAGTAFVAADGPSASRPRVQAAHAQGQILRREIRLEPAGGGLNHFGKKGWTVKAMSTPHLKGFSGALEEMIVVLLER